MKRYMIILMILLALVFAVITVRKRKLKGLTGLGKLNIKTRPPKVRIVYSKKIKPSEKIKITTSADAYQVFKEIWSKQIEIREEMVILLLDGSNSVLGYHILSIGGMKGTVSDMRLIYSVALNSLATSIIMAHSHPSGNLNPSKTDGIVTRRVKEAGEVMDIPLLDHIIITKDAYYSFADEGML